MLDVPAGIAAEASDREVPKSAVKSFFPNFRAAGRFALVAAVALFVLCKRYRGYEGLVGGAVALFASQSCISYLLGVRIKAERLTLPRPLLKRIPLLVLWRTGIGLGTMRDVTAAGQFLGFDVVILSSPDGALETVFASRKQRLAFFEAIKRRLPDIRIYRSN